MQQSGLAGLLPSLQEIAYVGLSAGSVVMAPNIGEALAVEVASEGHWKVFTA